MFLSVLLGFPEILTFRKRVLLVLLLGFFKSNLKLLLNIWAYHYTLLWLQILQKLLTPYQFIAIFLCINLLHLIIKNVIQKISLILSLLKLLEGWLSIRLGLLVILRMRRALLVFVHAYLFMFINSLVWLFIICQFKH